VFLLIFAAVALLADMFVTRQVEGGEALQAGRVARIIQGRDHDDYVILGSSQAHANFIPSVLGDHYYNYGITAAAQPIVNMMLRYELGNGSHNPIVLSIRQGEGGFIGDPRELLPFSLSPETRQTMERMGSWRWYYGVPGLRYFGSYDWYLKGILIDALQRRGASQLTAGRVAERGFHNDFDAPWSRAEFAKLAKKRLQVSERLGLEPQNQEELVKLIRSAPDRKFVLVLSPLNWAFLAHISNEATLNRQVAEWRALPNVTVIDWTHKRYPDEYYFDTGHLNRRGATVFSSELRPLLKQAFAEKRATRTS
jgi:hypothetical protein